MAILGNQLLRKSKATSDPYFNDVIFLSHFNTVISDLTGKIITSIGSPSIDETQFKFNGGSLLLNGSSALSVESSTAWNFPGDFTVEMWVRFSNIDGQQSCITNYADRYHGWAVQLYQGVLIASFSGDGIKITGQTPVSADEWHYIALVKQDSVFKLYLDESQQGDYTGSFDLQGEFLQIGYIANSAFLIGNIGDVRITNSARDVSVLPTSQFPDS